MTRTLKALGLALLAVCAVGAVATSSAWAEGTPDKFTCTKDGVNLQNCDITGEGSTTWGTKGSSLSIVCTHETYSGTIINNATEVTVKPTYTGCTAFGGAATVHTNGCAWVWKGTTTSHFTTSPPGTETDAGVTLECPNPELGIVVTGPGCTISVETTHTNPDVTVNHNLHGVKYINEGSSNTEDIKVKTTIDGIAYTTTGFGCALVGLPATGTDTTMTGEITVKGYTDNSPHNTTDHVGIKLDTP